MAQDTAAEKLLGMAANNSLYAAFSALRFSVASVTALSKALIPSDKASISSVNVAIIFFCVFQGGSQIIHLLLQRLFGVLGLINFSFTVCLFIVICHLSMLQSYFLCLP